MVGRLFTRISYAVRGTLCFVICIALMVPVACVEWLMTEEDAARIRKLREKLND